VAGKDDMYTMLKEKGAVFNKKVEIKAAIKNSISKHSNKLFEK
jgi:hypothetical protein